MDRGHASHEITSKSGRHGGTFAHRDIAFEFASWISCEFKLYVIVEFQRRQSNGDEAKERFTKFDKDKDGFLSREEFIKGGK